MRKFKSFLEEQENIEELSNDILNKYINLALRDSKAKYISGADKIKQGKSDGGLIHKSMIRKDNALKVARKITH